MNLNKPSLSGITEVLKAAEAKDVYILYYRTHIVGLSFKCFQFSGTQQEVFKRANAHCKSMGYRFMSVTPLFSDLEKDETEHLASGGNALASKDERTTAEKAMRLNV